MRAADPITRPRAAARLTSAAPAVARRALAWLREHGRGAADHPASGGYGTRETRLGVTLPELDAYSRELAREAKAWPPREAVALARALAGAGVFEARLLANQFLLRHRAGAAALTAADLEAIGAGNDNWAATDSFACYVAGPAWRTGRIPDARVHRWARSRDRWWRRTALAATVALNVKARGGAGDVPRTLAVCETAVADRDEMIVKALSWALRSALPHDPAAVRAFVARHEDSLAALVRREVATKLSTGRKHAPRGAAR